MDIYSKLLFVLSQRTKGNMSTRSAMVIKNIAISMSVKVANIISSLLILPLTINYVNPTQYGIWLSLSTIIGWVNFFDLGLGKGFQNKFAESKALGNLQLCRQYLSTTYFSITMIVIAVYVGILFINTHVDWTSVLKVDSSYRIELQKVFAIVCGFMCLNMIVNIFGSLLVADQKQGYASVIQGIGQYLSLLIIFILTKVSTGSLMNLAIYFSGVPCITMFFASIIMFGFSKYRQYAPKLTNIKPQLIKDILSLGAQFFIIYICLILIFQLVNIVLSREIGAVSVTEYNVANRYFNILYMIVNIVVTPFWAAFTDAYAQKDARWMKNCIKKLERLWLLTLVGGLLMLLVSPFLYKIWIGDNVDVPFALSISVLILTLTRTLGSIYMFLINGIGTIRIQLITYICFAIIAWPSLVYPCRWIGVCGIVIIPTIVYVVQILLAKVQLGKLLNGSAKGVWSK